MLYRCVLAVISSFSDINFVLCYPVCVTLTRQLCLLKAVLSITSIACQVIKDTGPLIEAVFLEYARYLNSLSVQRNEVLL